MNEYFLNNGVDTDLPIFNIEFELHRQFLRAYKIDTIQDALEKAESIFQTVTELIRMIDKSTLTDTDLKHHKLHKAESHPIWKQIKADYKISDFIQNPTPLERKDRIIKPYTLEKFIVELTELLLKATKNNLVITLEILKKILKDLNHVAVTGESK